MDYTKELINEDIIDLTKKIIEEVPYWMHYRFIKILETCLKRCFIQSEDAQENMILTQNKKLISSCLSILKIVTPSRES
jgi:hypothetical protein